MIATDNDINGLCNQLSILTLCPSSKQATRQFLIVPTEVQKIRAKLFWQVFQKALSLYPEINEVTLPGIGQFRVTDIKKLAIRKVEVEITALKQYLKQLEIAQIALEKLEEDGFSTLHIAAITNRPQLIPSDVSNSEIDKLDHAGRTPLQLAVHFGHEDVAKSLLQYGALPTLGTYSSNSALCQAALSGQNTLTTLLAKNVNLNNTHSTPFQKNILSGIVKEKQPDNKITEIATILFVLKHKRQKHYLESFTRALNLTSNPELVKRYYKEETIRRLIFHILKIQWSIRTSTDLTIPLQISYKTDATQLSFTPLTGGFQPYFLNKMAKITLKFKDSFSRTDSQQIRLSTLYSSLSNASNSSVNPKTLLFRWQTGHPIIISVTVLIPGHAVTVMLWHHYFFICNKGALSRKSVEIFQFKKEQNSIDVLAKLTTPFKTESDYNTYFFSELASTLCFRQRQVEKELEKSLSLPPQVIGNCAWESPEMCVYTYLVFSALYQRHLITPAGLQSTAFSSVITEQKSLFANWQLSAQLTYTEKYLQRLSVANREFFSSHELLEKVKAFYATIDLQQAHLLPHIKQKIEKLKDAYPFIL